MDHALPGAPMDPFYSDSDSMLNPLCHLCAIPFYQCIHAMPQAPYAAARMLYNEPEPEPFHTPLSEFTHTEADLGPIYAYVTEEDRQPLMNKYVRYIDADETTIQPATVQAHIEDIYTPGDRLQSRQPTSRKTPHRRQAPRPGGYPCHVEGCERVFDRACELNRHQKTHLDRSERPHKCSACKEGFLYPKDLHRHERKHIQQPSAQVTFFCRYPGCGNLEGFSRRDNLLRHQRKQHASIVAVA
ncbi:Nn.00g021510.m01.CDS01 [Neocucurbitaria sp. VM-36]